MKTYQEIADSVGLAGEKKRRYIAYMGARWHQEEAEMCESGEAEMWAERFKIGIEYDLSDETGRLILKSMDELDK